MVRLRSDIGVEYIQHAGTDLMIAKAARVSTGKDKLDNNKIEGLIRYLARERHTSPFEHTSVTVRIEAPIFVVREAMRHRTFSFNEISGRYAKLEPTFWVPDGDRPLVNAGSGAHPDLVPAVHDVTHPAVVTNMEAAYASAWNVYDYLISGDKDNGDDVIANEVARSVLPVGTYTSWYMTGNLHAWFKFLALRDGSQGHPQEEIQELANKVWPILVALFPVATQAWREETH